MKMNEMTPGQYARITNCLTASNPYPGDIVMRASNDTFVTILSANNWQPGDFFDLKAAECYEVELAPSYGLLCEKTINHLRDTGHAVAIFNPEELRGADPRDVADMMVSRGWDAITDLVGPESEDKPAVTLYADPVNPTGDEINYDLSLEAKALKGDTTAAYELGAREAYLSCTTNLEAGGEPVEEAYEEGRADYMPKDEDGPTYGNNIL